MRDCFVTSEIYSRSVELVDLIKEYKDEESFFYSVKKSSQFFDKLMDELNVNTLDFLNYLYYSKSKIIRYKRVEEVPESPDLIYNADDKAIYHLYQNCEMFDELLIDFKVPDEIRFEKTDLIDTFRRWFIKTSLSSRKDIDKEMVQKFNSEFAANYSLKTLSSDYKFRVNLPYLEKKAIKQNFYYSEVNLIVEGLYKKQNYLRKTKKVTVEDLISLKKEAIELMLEYYKWSFYDLKSNEEYIWLGDFGLEMCYTCQQKFFVKSGK